MFTHSAARVPAFALALLTLLGIIVFPLRARADDYDERSSAWNGLSEVVHIAQQSGVDLRPSTELTWNEIRPGDGLLLLYPRGHVELADLSGFLEDGGRLGLFDDFGESAPLMQWFQVTRIEQVNGRSRSTEIPGLYTAIKHSDHPLGDGVDSLVTNFPVALAHPRLAAIFEIDGDTKQGVIFAGQVGAGPSAGRLVLGGDPSVLINTMMRFPGNRRFALNLLTYLAGHTGGRVHLIHGNFTEQGTYRNRSNGRTPAHKVVRSIDDAVKDFTAKTSGAMGAQIIASVIAMLAVAVLATRTWGSPPSDKLGPSAPAGTAASLVQKYSLFTRVGANMLYPTLLARRMLERESLARARMNPPTDVGALLERLKWDLTAEQAVDLRKLLVELDAIATRSDEDGPDASTAHVGETRFLSIWQRISAILPALRRSEGHSK